mgnify:FL=1
MEYKRIRLPLSNEDILGLRAGEAVLLSGELYTARDAAHKRLFAMLQGAQGAGLPQGWPLPAPCAIYYAGPCPAAPGEVIGPCGPTTSARMDVYTPAILSAGATALIGKGPRSPAVLAALRGRAVYFAVTGGAGMLIAHSIKKVEMAAFPELGTEAIRRFIIEDMPAIVACDSAGGNLYAR